jgi:hypothetical protein
VNDQLTVHLVDANKKPVSAFVTVQEVRSYPMLGSMKFLPPWARQSTRTNTLDVIDRTVKVRRIKAPGNDTLLIIRAKLQPSEFLVFLTGETNSAGLYRWPEKGTERREIVKPQQTDVSVILD